MHSLVALLIVSGLRGRGLRLSSRHVVFFKITYAEAGEVPPPPPVNESELTPFSAVVRWNPPSDSNGVILRYTVNYVAVLNTSSQEMGRRRRQTSGASAECILGGQRNVNRNMTVDGSQTSATLTELSEYTYIIICVQHLLNCHSHENLAPGTVYKFRVQAETAVGGGPFSTSRNFTTSENGILTIAYKCTSGFKHKFNTNVCYL